MGFRVHFLGHKNFTKTASGGIRKTLPVFCYFFNHRAFAFTGFRQAEVGLNTINGSTITIIKKKKKTVQTSTNNNKNRTCIKRFMLEGN